LNVLIGKFGRSIYFDKARWSIYAGDEEAPLLFIALAKAYPQHTFYMVGRSDVSKYRESRRGRNVLFADLDDGTLDVPDNIVDLWEGFNPGDHQYVFTLNEGASYPEKLKQKIAEGTYAVTRETVKNGSLYVYVQPKLDWHAWMEQKIAGLGLKFDAGVIYQGPTPAVGIPNMGISKVDAEGDAQTQLMFKMYYAPIMHTLNLSQVPYVLLNGDPRYIPLLHRDCFNDEKVILSQINTTRTVKRITGYHEKSKDYRFPLTTYVYAGIETVFLMGEKKVDFRGRPKNNRFVMGLNGGGDREQIIKEWVLDRPETKGIKIYGKWSPAIVDKYPGVFEEKGIAEVSDVFWDSRYTLIPPYYNSLSDFVTQKFWKMIVFGIVPFFHPKYDTSRIFDVPKALRVRSPNEMWATIERLDSDPDEFKAIQESLWNMLRDDYYTGEYLINKVTVALRGTANIDLRTA
jgi:hypothetical protein